MKIAKRNKTQEKKVLQMETVAHHQLAYAQPAPEPWPPQTSSLQFYILIVIAYSLGYPLGQLGSAVLGCPVDATPCASTAHSLLG